MWQMAKVIKHCHLRASLWAFAMSKNEAGFSHSCCLVSPLVSVSP